MSDMYSDYLKSGNYQMSIGNKKIIFIQGDSCTKDFVEKNFKRPNTKEGSFFKKIFRKIKDLILYFVKIKNNENNLHKYNGTIAMLSWDNDIKIFNLDKNVVITFFSTNEKFEQYINIINDFKNYFNVTFINAIKEKQATIEILINKSSPYINNDKKSLYYREIIGQYINYFTKVSPRGVTSELLLLKELEKSGFQIFNDYMTLFQNSFNQEVPNYLMHADLHFDNILIQKDKIYYIDWEHCSYRPFYYDIYNILFIEIMNHNNYYLFNEYINGRLDAEFTLLFKSAGMIFDTQYRRKYFFIFLFYRFLKFDLVNNDPLGVITRYKGFLTKLSRVL